MLLVFFFPCSGFVLCFEIERGLGIRVIPARFLSSIQCLCVFFVTAVLEEVAFLWKEAGKF
jgi:hypothetical protein